MWHNITLTIEYVQLMILHISLVHESESNRSWHLLDLLLILIVLSATGIEDKHLLYIVVCSESKILIGCMKISDDHKIDRK